MRTKQGDAVWRAAITKSGCDYCFQGMTELLFADLTVCLSGRLFIAVAPLESLVGAYTKAHNTRPADLAQLCGWYHSTGVSDLNLLGAKVTTVILSAGECLQTPAGYVRAEGHLSDRTVLHNWLIITPYIHTRQRTSIESIVSNL